MAVSQWEMEGLTGGPGGKGVTFDRVSEKQDLRCFVELNLSTMAVSDDPRIQRIYTNQGMQFHGSHFRNARPAIIRANALRQIHRAMYYKSLDKEFEFRLVECAEFEDEVLLISVPVGGSLERSDFVVHSCHGTARDRIVILSVSAQNPPAMGASKPAT